MPIFANEECPPSLPGGWFCQDGYLWGPAVNYEGHDFQNKLFLMEDASIVFPLQGVKLNDARELFITVKNGPGIDAENLQANNITTFRFTAENCTQELDFTNAQFEGATNPHFRFEKATETAAAPVSFQNANFTQAAGILLRTHGGEGNWNGADFDGANIRRLTTAEPGQTWPEFTTMDGVNFGGAEFIGNANANEPLGNFRFIDFTMNNTTFVGAIMDCQAYDFGVELPVFSTREHVSGATPFNSVDFTNASLRFVDFHNVDMTDTTVTGADFTGLY